jgi:hypothetical protein
MKSNVFTLLTKIIFLILLLVTSACEKTQNKSAIDTIVIGSPAYISLLKEYKINDNLFFSIDSISDYRCPLDVECFWSGDVDLLFDINQNGVKTDTLIHAITNRNNPFTLNGYKWKVVEVTPARYDHKALHPEDYLIEILIQ